MIENISLNAVIEMGSKEPENAMLVFSATNIITEGLGGRNEIVGGIWVLLLSLIALKGHLYSKPLNFLGILSGSGRNTNNLSIGYFYRNFWNRSNSLVFMDWNIHDT